MADFAVIENSGKQYIVKPGDTIYIDELTKQNSKVITFDKVLLVNKKDKLELGLPYIKDYTVKGNVLGVDQNPKITTSKFKAKSRYRKKSGSRQKFLAVSIKSI